MRESPGQTKKRDVPTRPHQADQYCGGDRAMPPLEIGKGEATLRGATLAPRATPACVGRVSSIREVRRTTAPSPGRRTPGRGCRTGAGTLMAGRGHRVAPGGSVESRMPTRCHTPTEENTPADGAELSLQAGSLLWDSTGCLAHDILVSRQLNARRARLQHRRHRRAGTTTCKEMPALHGPPLPS